MRRLISISVVAAFAVAILLVTVPNSFKAATENEGAQPWGSWYWVLDVSSVAGPGTTLPALVTLHQDGSLIVDEGTMFGGYIGATEVVSPGHGTWIKTGGGTFRGIRLGFVFDKASGLLIGFSRSRFSFHFGDNFDQIEGRIFVERLSCSDGPFTCPDPLDPAAVWTPASPPDGFPASARRIHTVPVD